VAISVYASASATPESLLESLKQKVRVGDIETWSIDSDGDFTHTPQQWKDQAYLRPRIVNGVLQFFLIGRKSVKMSKEVYGVYHGRFSEMLLTHFDTSMRELKLSSLRAPGDVFT
jgi:hypothetical protein